ncbi:MAG: hypothetical protein ACSLE0_06475 [Chitinophagaceae bacterium]
MKKGFIVALTVFFLLLVSFYFFIPGKIFVTQSINSTTNLNAVYRFLSQDSNWAKWWPQPAQATSHSSRELQFGDYRFTIVNPLYNAFEINIEKGGHTISSLLHLVQSDNDTIKIEWSAASITGFNPVLRIRRYFAARGLKNKMDIALGALEKYISEVKHLYGLDIRKEKVKIEYLVTMNKSFTHYPATEDVYDLIGLIRNRIKNEQAREEDNPMLHVKIIDSSHFEAQVAIPVNIELPDTENFATKRMLKNGDILVSEIKGGRYSGEMALKQLGVYAMDHRYNNIAIPFLSLVTDRMKEPDSTNWVTRVYYPIN